MANATITVLEADGTTETDVVVLDVGRQAAAASKSVAASTEDKAVLDAIAASLALLDNSIATGNELQVDIVGALPAGTAAIGKVKVTNDAGTVIDPVAAGPAAKAGAVPTTLSTDETIVPTAVAHGVNPAAVAASAQANPKTNRAGIPFVIGGHPNIICRNNVVLDSDGAQTDASLAGAISAGTKIIITQMSIKADKNNSGNVAVKVGFGTANVPTPALAGVNGLIFNEDLGAGEGHQIGHAGGIVAIGGDGEELRLTCDDPAGGSLTVGYSYYTIES